jgi:probable HAF family extracellular repeat protein
MTDLGTLPNILNSFANGVSSNGAVVAGTCRAPSGYSRAFRWTGGVMTDLGTPSGGGWGAIAANGVSANGAVVVGSAAKANSTYAFRWTGGTMTNLGTLKGGSDSEAADASSNGSVVVGTSDSKKGDRAFRWTGGTMTDLGTVPGQPYSYGLAVSVDGTIVVGFCGDGTTETSPGGATLGTGHAMLYSAATGMVDLNAFLPAQFGIDLTGWELSAVRDISDDGTTIVGWGWHYDGLTDTIRPEAWIVRMVP